MRRVVDVVGGRWLRLKTATTNKLSQQWYFDQTTKTIMNVGNKGKSIDIDGNGKNSNLQIATTNSRWW
jgi:hypothetical protein